MPISVADHGMLLLTPDLLQRDGRYELSMRRPDETSFGRSKLRFPPIEDLVCLLDHIASREIAA